MTEFVENISNDELAQLPLGQFEGRIVVIDSQKGLNEACDHLLAQRAIGFDTETRPAFTAGSTNRVALLQLATAECCYLFRLSAMPLDRAVTKVLENQEVIKVGAAVRDDLKALIALRNFKPRGFVDLQSIVNRYGIRELSLRKMAAIVLGIRISKAQRLSNWEAEELTELQQVYAATDAWAALEIYNKLEVRSEKCPQCHNSPNSP